MAQQTVVRSISEYPFKKPDMEIVASNFSGQGITISGTMWCAENITTNEKSANAITTRNYVIPNSTQTFARSQIFDENAVYHIALERIDTDGKMLRFVEPITASIAFHDNAYFCQNEELGILSMSASFEDCIKDFQEEILFVWNEYGKEDDNRLTNDAKELKRRILRYISK